MTKSSAAAWGSGEEAYVCSRDGSESETAAGAEEFEVVEFDE